MTQPKSDNCIWFTEGTFGIRWNVGRRYTKRPIRSGEATTYDETVQASEVAFNAVTPPERVTRR